LREITDGAVKVNYAWDYLKMFICILI
jgi:hypothetical protein